MPPLTPQNLIDAAADIEALELVVNSGPEAPDVVTRLGQTISPLSKVTSAAAAALALTEQIADESEQSSAAVEQIALLMATAPGTYATTAAGLTAVLEGQSFWVRSASGGLELYTKTGGVAVFVNVFGTSYVATLRSHGAKADVQEVRDSVMTAGSAVLTSATAGFTAADVGKSVTVEAAGAGGGILRSTIVARTSATQVTLGTAATSTVNNTMSVWGTNCSAALQSALDALTASKGGTLIIDGLFFLASPVTKDFGGETAGAAVSIIGYGSKSAVWISVPDTQDAITLSSATITCRDFNLVGVAGVTADARRIINLSGAGATFERCQFQGLLAQQGIIYADGCALHTRHCSFGGSMVLGEDGAVYASIENRNWVAYSDDGSSFIDYGYFRNKFYGRTAVSANLSWIRVHSPSPQLGARAPSVVRIKDTHFDEGSLYGLHVEPTVGRIQAVEVEGLRSNVAPFLDGRSVHMSAVDRAVMRNCVAGWSTSPSTRFAHFEDCTEVLIEGQRLDTPQIDTLSATNVESLRIVDAPAGLTNLLFTNVNYHPISTALGSLAIVKEGAVTDSDFLAPPAASTMGLDQNTGRLYLRGPGDWAYFEKAGGSLFKELVVNGQFGTDTAGWTGVGATLSVVGGAMRVTVTGFPAYSYQTIHGLEIGRRYTFSGNASNGTAGIVIRLGQLAQGEGGYFQGGAGAFEHDFIANDTDVYITVIANSENAGAYVSIDDVKLRRT